MKDSYIIFTNADGHKLTYKPIKTQEKMIGQLIWRENISTKFKDSFHRPTT